ncbi:ribbon-helix-helix protein, CopG family [Scytonema sp. PCC 10023]
MVRLSKQKERSMNDLIREAVRQYFERETKG